ncbi:hypothetical protein GCM10025868_39530 [Angustibacter aerolatus]|uniref:Uncharacterized protein n=1 Tax=Angustibacter aerolatus TaxID=1162965 RepID=A0ABQ6JL21_9ACTN|nr:hypothetical protein GCM10025868_39530 [Angustibacter aerolatus]
MRVLAAMSGGVDSAVAAARAVEAGHDVVGVHLALSRSPQAERTGARGCCTIEDASDARRSADVLGIPFYVWDLAETFQAAVVDDFVAEYAAGRTPNPCVRCNERVKFAALLDRAVALGFDALCTGHYARVEGGRLLRAADHRKDQSYVLGVLTPEQIARAVLPLGGSVKDDVRAEAARRGLPVAAKPDKYDVCFVPDGDTAGWLADRLGSRPGRCATSRARCSATTTGRTRSPSGSARACGSDAPPRTAAPATCSTCSRSAAPSWSARPSGSTCSGCAAARCAGAGRPRATATGCGCRCAPTARRCPARCD